MFQREVAQRLVAIPGNKSFGRLSLLANWRCNVSARFDVPPEAFTPAPKVTSSVVQFESLKTAKFDADAAVLQELTKFAFGQRRKMLRSSLKSRYENIDAQLIKAGIDPTDRAEQIDLARFCRLARLLAAP